MFAAAVIMLSSCTPGEVEGEVLREEWSPFECVVWLRLPSGDAVDVRLVLAVGGRAGYDPAHLKAAKLTGKRLRCRLSAGRKASCCAVITRDGEQPLRKIGER